MSDLLSTVGGFAKGFGEGVWSGATGLVKGLGSLAEGAYNLAIDSDARTQAWNDAVQAAHTAEWAMQNPGQAASATGQGAQNLYDNFVTAEQQAEAKGQGAEFWGNIAGQAAFAVGTVAVPGLAEAKLAGAAGEAGELAEGAIQGATALTDEGAGASFLLRGDARPMSDIFENGFQPWGGNASLEDYVLNNAPSQYVGLTTDPNVAADFATAGGTQDGLIYATDPQPNGIVVNDVMPNNPFASEQEIAVPGGVPASQIRGATPISANSELGDFSVLNPNYEGPTSALPDLGVGSPPSGMPSLLNGGSLAGAGLLGAGALGNAMDPGITGQGVPNYSVTYSVNPDGSLTTISPLTLTSPGNPSITPPAPIALDPPLSSIGDFGGGGGIDDEMDAD